MRFPAGPAPCEVDGPSRCAFTCRCRLSRGTNGFPSPWPGRGDRKTTAEVARATPIVSVDVVQYSRLVGRRRVGVETRRLRDELEGIARSIALRHEGDGYVVIASCLCVRRARRFGRSACGRCRVDSQPLFYDPVTVWSDPNISVCWEGNYRSTERGWVRGAVERAYEPFRLDHFHGLGRVRHEWRRHRHSRRE